MHRMYSRKIIDETFRLKALGLTDKQIAAQCGVSVFAVRHWRYGTRRTPETESGRADYCPRCSTGQLDPEAYPYLLGLYLGDGYIGRIRRDVTYLSIACCNTWPGLMTECVEAMRTVFPVSVFKVQRQGCTEVKGTSTHWTCIFPQHGPGKKHERLIALEAWQQELVDARPDRFIRGLIHSDGCRVTNRIRKRSGEGFHEYPRYHFTNTSTDIVGLLTAALDRLGIPWKSHIKRPEPHNEQVAISISRKAAVARMDAFVGPKY